VVNKRRHVLVMSAPLEPTVNVMCD